MSTTLFDRLCSVEHLFRAWEHVKKKNAAGGVDGESVTGFEASLEDNLAGLAEELSDGKWIPQPYMRIEIPKKTNEKRRLGLLTVRDKIVQQGIRMLIEPRCERLFLNNSYGYRPGKGAVKAIRRALSERQRLGTDWALKLDIDDFFDNVDHEELEARVSSIVNDPEILRLVMLSVKMGVVSKSMKWQDVAKGLPQGAVLSPVLANLYLHSFDQYVTSKTQSYVRYADDFVIFATTREEAMLLCAGAEEYLKGRLKLTLNSPSVVELSDGFEFLGMTIKKDSFGISDSKRAGILAEIASFSIGPDGLARKSAKRWAGIGAYYGVLLQEEELLKMDAAFYSCLENSVKTAWRSFQNRSVLGKAISGFKFLSAEYRLKDKELKKQIVDLYLKQKRLSREEETDAEINKVIRKRKQEYVKKESENSELVIAKRGVSVGLTTKGVTVKSKGVVIRTFPTANLKHIMIISDGVALSSNLLTFVMKRKIPLDVFEFGGGHLGSFLPASSFQCVLWHKQARASLLKRNALSAAIIDGKLTNQLNLVKYYNKYHKLMLPDLQQKLNELEGLHDSMKAYVKTTKSDDPEYMKVLLTFESQGALKYWECVRCLLSNDDVGFEKREHQGAKDLVNCLLNYGYAIIYARCWQALLAAQLNPYDSVVHVRQSGKPTLAFDFIELFRAQAVDRVVISLVQKNEPLEIKDGRLSDATRKLLAKNITERLYKREKFRGENMPFARIIKVQAREIAGYFESEEVKFKPYKAKW